jgi:peptidyl-prolyl cis-trans isomerase SurA
MQRLSLTFTLLAGLLPGLAVLAPAGARAQAIVAVVNGAPISSRDVDSRSALLKLSHQDLDKKMVLESLIEERLKMMEARRVDLLPDDDEVNEAFTNIARNMKMSPEQLTQGLSTRGVPASTLKARLRADLGWNRFVREKFRATTPIQDQDVVAALSKKTDQEKAKVEKTETYRVASVILVMPKNAPAALVAQRKAEASALRGKFKSCTEGIAYARTLRDVAVKPIISRTTSGLSGAVREILDKTPEGTLTDPEEGDEGIEMFAVCEKKTETGSMAMQAAVREELTTSGMEVQARKYISDLRARAVIEYR